MPDTAAPRPAWDDYFMTITRQVATRSTCLRRHCGAVIVKDRRILATGYNGTPKGVPHCEDVGCIRTVRNIPSGENHELCRGIHAEQNAIIQAALHGVAIDGSIVYTTHQPCILCAKMLINAGVTEIVFGAPYPDPLSEQMLQEAGIPIRVYVEPSGEPGSK